MLLRLVTADTNIRTITKEGQCLPLDLGNSPKRQSFVVQWLRAWTSESKLVVVRSLRPVQLFVTPWNAALQASLFLIISRSLFKFMSIEMVMLSNHLILCHPLLFLQSFPASRSFLKSQFFASGSQVLEFQQQSFQCIVRVDFLQDLLN